MGFTDRVDTYTYLKKEDGRGGFEYIKKFKETIFCKLYESDTEINKKHFITADKTIILHKLSKVDIETLFLIEDSYYKINTFYQKSGKYYYILEVI